MGDIPFGLFSLIMNGLYLMVGLVAFYGALRLLDKLSGVDFKGILKNMEGNGDAMPVAIYFAARIIAVAIVASAFLR